jgi:hypothetical protein
MARFTQLNRLITYKTRRLDKLKGQQALQGIETPAGVLLEIEDLVAELEELEAELEAEVLAAESFTAQVVVSGGTGTKRLEALPGDDFSFDHDIFISYTYLDNQTISQEQKGRIAHFHKALEIQLGQLLGETPQIWRDPKRQSGDTLSPEALERLTKTALLLPVLSPGYLRSAACLQEIDHFLQAATRSGGLFIGPKPRLFKVIKTEVPSEDHPPEIQGLPDYRFYELDPATGRPRDFIQGFGANIDHQ